MKMASNGLFLHVHVATNDMPDRGQRAEADRKEEGSVLDFCAVHVFS